jgi:hypothetical protein
VLCISATAGQGKSTVSALLCKSDRGAAVQGNGESPAGHGSSITAYHFAKFSDARRLDPVRIVKSLAFQLALRSVAWALVAGAPVCVGG